jgi:hypothetical protein
VLCGTRARPGRTLVQTPIAQWHEVGHNDARDGQQTPSSQLYISRGARVRQRHQRTPANALAPINVHMLLLEPQNTAPRPMKKHAVSMANARPNESMRTP